MSLRIDLQAVDVANVDADVVALLLTEGGLEKQKAFATADEALGGALTGHVRDADFKGASEQVLDLPLFGALGARRLVLVGLGARRKVSGTVLRVAAAIAARQAGSQRMLALIPGQKCGVEELRALAEGLELGAYRFSKYFTGGRVPKKTLERVVIDIGGSKASPAAKKSVANGQAVAAGVNLARDAVNEPPNVLTPEAMAQVARKIAKDHKLKISVLDEKALKKAQMNLYLAVGRGSANPPRLIHLTYAPPKAKKTLVFVGKGLTFDSGGLCIKPAPGMGEMKSDMGGAAAVLGLMTAVAALRPQVAVHGIIGAAENMPDGDAYRPADVIRSLDGKTVEVINTDAEGRLVLADVLAYARELAPDVLIDAATLTGACLVALGKGCSAFYTGEEGLAKAFEKAAKTAGEQFWRMPLIEDLREQLTSDVADLKHTGDRMGGSITAALFLREFVGDSPWIHCDIAGPVLADRPKGIYPKGATGHPVLTFLSFVESA